MNEKKPLVSIVVRTKDRPKLLEKALQSIAAQTYRPIEVVLVNDGGCDLDIDGLKTILGDVSLNYIRLAENRGRARAGNAGIENAKGEYIGFLDDDDEFYPEHVETLVSFLMQSDYQVAYTDSNYAFQEWITDKYVTVSKEVLYSQDFDRQRLLIANFIPMLNVLCRKDLLCRAGLFDEKLEAHEDWDLWLRFSQYSDFYHIKKVTAEISMRTDGTTITSSNRMAFLETARIIHKRYSPFAADENIINSQNAVEWSLAKEVVTRGEELENSYLVDIAETLIQQKDTEIGNLEAAIREKDTEIGKILSLFLVEVRRTPIA
ncbi:MAG: glycosyltransferase [Thermodesulfovibrionales bacterium]|nr:glycosyltransferase [Thermodesulfovibrionales bacterium]